MNFLCDVNPTVGENGISYMIWIWLGVIVLATLIEILTMDITSIWFALAGFVAMILAIFPVINWYVQLAVFFVVALVCLIALRPFAKKMLAKKNSKTNVDALVGRKTKLLTACDFETFGTVKFGDVVWNVLAENDDSIEAGSIVVVQRVEGNKLIVVKFEEEK